LLLELDWMGCCDHAPLLLLLLLLLPSLPMGRH
jgi:hypothetical protein